MRWFAPLTFVLTSLAIYWTMWPTTIQVILVILVGIPIYFYYEVKYQKKDLNTNTNNSPGKVIFSHLA